MPIALTDGQRVAVTVNTPRGAVLTGTLTEALGHPAPPPVQVTQIPESAASES